MALRVPLEQGVGEVEDKIRNGEICDRRELKVTSNFDANRERFMNEDADILRIREELAGQRSKMNKGGYLIVRW